MPFFSELSGSIVACFCSRRECKHYIHDKLFLFVSLLCLSLAFLKILLVRDNSSAGFSLAEKGE